MAESRAVIEYQTKKNIFDIISKEIFCHLCKIVPREPPIYFSSTVKEIFWAQSFTALMADLR